MPPGGDIPAKFQVADESFDHHRREVEIAMRDGVKLHTVILVPKDPGAAGKMPILLTRTPYDADKATTRAASPRLQAVVSSADDVVALAGYIRVFQDVRGKHGSEGDYVMNRPLRGPLNPTAVDHATDTWDTIDWLVKNVPETNGRVGMIGTSYPGFLVLMGLFDPHPALKVAVPVNPIVDCWIGDDWFHNGAFRQAMALYVYEQTAGKKNDFGWWTGSYDDYTRFLTAGSAGALGREMGMEQLPFWRRLTQHPAYDSYWQEQAVDRLLRRQPLTVPTLHVGGLWDQEDIYGAPASYAALEAKDTANDRNFLVLGPWRHGGSNGDGRSLGAIRFDGDTALAFRRDVLQPFLDRYLKESPKPGAAQPPVLAYQTGANRWQRYDRWPQSCTADCPNVSRKLYLEPGFGLGWSAPAATSTSSPVSTPAADAYVSDPAKPVPYRQRPARPMWAEDSTWGEWLVDDQRVRLGPHGRPGLRLRCSHRAARGRGHPGREPLRVHHRQRRRLGGEAHRPLPRRGPHPARARWLPVGRVDGHPARPLSRELREAFADPRRQHRALPLDPAGRPPRLRPGPPRHGADPVHLVPALRPQPADLGRQHFLRPTRRLPPRHPPRLPQRRDRELRRAAGRRGGVGRLKRRARLFSRILIQ